MRTHGIFLVQVWNFIFNPFLANVPITPPNTPENLWFSGVFRGYTRGTWARNWLILDFSINFPIFGHRKSYFLEKVRISTNNII